MRVGSLFSGIGGIELGFEKEGFETAWFVELDPYARAVLKKHWPGVKVFDDVTKLDWGAMPPVDVLTGGFPCQDASIANVKGEGIGGARTGLWKHYLAGIRALRPKFVVAENVPNLLNRGFAEVVNDLAEIGYGEEGDVVRYELLVEAEGERYVMERERLVTIAYPDSPGRQGLPQDSSDANLEHRALAQALLARWENELPRPLLLGVGDVFPSRLDRTRCTGNAVSPRMAQAIAIAIKRAE